jgi:hypothetical protein
MSRKVILYKGKPMKSKILSCVVLNDGETYTGDQGCVYLEYDDAALGDDSPDLCGDADLAVKAVEEGTVKGRILKIDKLVALYDVVQSCLKSAPSKVPVKIEAAAKLVVS